MLKARIIFLLFSLAAAVPGQPQSSPPPATGTTIRINASEVALDLVVRDKKGKVVKNLKPSDVEVLEDGVSRKVLSFRLVQGREQKAASANAPAARKDAAGSMNLPELNTVCIVFHNIDPVTRPHAIEIVKQFIRSNLPPQTYIGIFNLNEKLIAVHEFTRNREELLASSFNGAIDFNKASVALLTASPNVVTLNVQVSQATRSANVTEDMTGGELSPTVIVGADVSNGIGASRARGDQVREQADFANITGMRETDRINTVINQIATLPGRKTVLLVSTGLTTTGDPDIFQKLVTAANSHGITFYSLDSTEMSATFDTAQGSKLAVGQVANVSQQQGKSNPSASVMRQNSHQNDDTIAAVRTSDSQSSLRALAEGTGGFLIANTNDFRKPFQQLSEDLETHYELVYPPVSSKLDGRLRKIEVKLARPDWQVESRTGYYALPESAASLTQTESTAMAVMNANPKPHAFDFHVAAYHFRRERASATTALAFEVPSAKLGSTADAAHATHRFTVGLLALVRDSEGEVVGKYSLEKPYTVMDANLAALRADPLTYTHTLDLPPGRYSVDAAVLDREGAQATTATASFEIPVPAKGISISSLAMARHLDPAAQHAEAGDPFTFQGKHVAPMVQASAATGEKRWVYFVVYKDPSSAEKPKIHVEFKNGGKVVADQTADLPAADKDGAIAMFVAAPVRPGDCELQITAMQGSESATRRLSYSGPAQ
jgi:VWFA-related protein